MGAVGALWCRGWHVVPWVPWPSPVFPGAAMPSLKSRMAAFRLTMAPGPVRRHSSNHRLLLGGMGPGAPGFVSGHLIADTGKLSLAHATRKSQVSEYYETNIASP